MEEPAHAVEVRVWRGANENEPSGASLAESAIVAEESAVPVAKASRVPGDWDFASPRTDRGRWISGHRDLFEFGRTKAAMDGRLRLAPSAEMTMDEMRVPQVQLPWQAWVQFQDDCLEAHDYWNRDLSCQTSRPVRVQDLPACYDHGLRWDTGWVAGPRDAAGYFPEGEETARAENEPVAATVVDENDYLHTLSVPGKTAASNRGVHANNVPDRGDRSSKSGDVPNQSRIPAKIPWYNLRRSLKMDRYKPRRASKRTPHQDHNLARK